MNNEYGFITIATGKEEYFQLAVNLLHSYHHFTKNPLPFALLCDKENEYTREFDDVIAMEDASCSYLDKLSLDQYIPYDITIFIDADCLAYGDLNDIFTYFERGDDFSCLGRVLPLDDKTGWFEYENLGGLKEKVSYVVGLHGGIYYMRKGDVCANVFKTARKLVPDYTSFKFKGKFDTPGDEPLIALSMALNNCKPLPFSKKLICCYWEYLDRMHLDIVNGTAEGFESGRQSDGFSTDLVHWGTRYTRTAEYKQQIELLNILDDTLNNKKVRIDLCRKKYHKIFRQNKRREFNLRLINKIKRVLRIK